MGTLLQWMEHKFGGGTPGGPKRKNTLLWVIMVGLLGAALMILNAFINVKELDPINTGRASPPPAKKLLQAAPLRKTRVFMIMSKPMGIS